MALEGSLFKKSCDLTWIERWKQYFLSCVAWPLVKWKLFAHLENVFGKRNDVLKFIKGLPCGWIVYKKWSQNFKHYSVNNSFLGCGEKNFIFSNIYWVPPQNMGLY